MKQSSCEQRRGGLCILPMPWDFPHSSVGKESACNAGDLGSIPALLRSPGEGKGYPLQYSGLENFMDCIVHGIAKNWTRLSNFTFTFHFHALEKEMATHSSVLAWRIPGMGEPGGLPSMGSHRVGHDWSGLAAAAAATASTINQNRIPKFANFQNYLTKLGSLKHNAVLTQASTHSSHVRI